MPAPNRPKPILSRLRPFIQGGFFVLYILLFFRVSYPLSRHFIDHLFFSIDPLVSSLMIITGATVTTALFGSALMIVATLLFGRFFCGFLCPLGTTFDIAARIIPTRKPRHPFGIGRFTSVKWYLLAILFAGSVMGFTALLFFDPLVFFFRVLTLNIFPSLVFLANLKLDAFRPLASSMGWYDLAGLSYPQPVYELSLTSLALFSAVLGLVVLELRFWCRNLCPLGGLLGVFSRFSFRARRVSDACTSCSKCARVCPMNAIGDTFKTTNPRECIQCERCTAACPVGAISFGIKPAPEQRETINPSRRGLIAAGIGGVLTGLAAGSATSTAARHGELLRPPGSLKEPDFLDACLRCGECMKICPTHGLQPSILQGGFEGVYTPVFTPRIGACEEECNLCGQICPTGAIRRLPLEEKKFVVIGNAVIDHSRCIAWEQNKVCLICDEVCPYDAVEFKVITDQTGSSKRPFVNEEKCVGCGQCENGCPVNGPKAIRVTPINEIRKNEGSYITEKAKKLREVNDDFVDFSHETGTASTDSTGIAKSSAAPASPDMEMPAGFDDEMPAGFTQ